MPHRLLGLDQSVTAVVSAPLYLKLGEEGLQSFPFVNAPFEIKIFLLDGDSLKCGDEVPLLMKFQYEGDEGNETPLPVDLFTVETDRPIIGKNGMTTVRIRINDVSMSYANRAFIVIFSIDKNDNSPVYWRNIEDISSPPMLCVRHRLSLNTDMADKWYKDEGGKDNRMDLTVNLLSANGCHVSGRRVPLKIFLMYENGQPVLKQEVLSLSPDCRLLIEEGGGSCVLKVRINDVSKNHQRQRFRIMVQPDTGQDPLLNDISCDDTHPVEVKSKRSKRLREDIPSAPTRPLPLDPSRRATSSSNLGPFGPAIQSGVPNRTVGSNGYENPSKLQRVQQDEFAHVQIDGYDARNNGNNTNENYNIPYSSSGNHDTNYNNDDNNNNTHNNDYNHLNKSRNNDYQSNDVDYNENHNITDQKKINNLVINSHLYGINNQAEFNNNENLYNDNSKSTYVSTDLPDPIPVDISSAIHTILQWTTSNVSRMSQLRWSIVGRERNSDGGVNESSHPIYAMSNPNDLINTVLQERSSGVIENSINILKQFMNNEKNKNENETEVKNENLDVYNVDNGVHRNFMRHRKDDTYDDENHIDIDKMNNDHINTHNTHNNNHNIHENENNDKLDNKEKKSFLNNGVQMENNGHRLGGIDKGEQDIENNQYLSENIYYVLARQTLIKGLDSKDVRDLKNNRTGLPAYDKNKVLLGFCEESRDSNNTTTIGFVPISELEELSKEELKSLVTLFEMNVELEHRNDHNYINDIMNDIQNKNKNKISSPKAGNSSSSSSSEKNGDANTDKDNSNPHTPISENLVPPDSPVPSATSLYSLFKYPNLEILKQEAMMHCWMAEMAIFEIAGDDDYETLFSL